MQDTLNERNIWGPTPDVFNVETDEEFQILYDTVQNAILKTFRLHVYNTIDTFVEFHQAFRSQNELNLAQFNSVFPATFDDAAMSCIGIDEKVIGFIAESDPSVSRCLYRVIAQDYSFETPVPKAPPSDELALLHDHMLVALEIKLKGRSGYFLIDAGVALDKPVVVMRDGLPPHTGKFRQRGRTGYREHSLDFDDLTSSYVVWKIREFRENNELKDRKRFVYLGRPFLQIDELEKRNRIDPFHAYLLMGPEGIRACLYFVLGKNERSFRLTVPADLGELTTVYMPYDFFCAPLNKKADLARKQSKESVAVYRALDTFSRMCQLGGTEAMWEKFRPMSEVFKDVEFLDEVVRLNDRNEATLHAALV